MNKREFLTSSGKLALALGATSAGISSIPTAVGQSNPGYLPIEPPQPTGDPNKVEVLEFFWFGCPHCFAFEPAINQWKKNKPDYVSFVRAAPPLNRSWEGHSRFFYAAEQLGVTEQVFEPLFDAIHKDRRRLRQPKDLAAFAGEMGLDKDKFLKAMDSFSVNAGIKRSILIAQGARVTGVPSLMVNGRYMTSPSMAGTYEQTFEILDRLTAMEKERMAG